MRDGKIHIRRPKDHSQVSVLDYIKPNGNGRYYEALSFSPDKKFLAAQTTIKRTGRPKPEILKVDGSGSIQLDVEMPTQVSFLPNGLVGVTRFSQPLRLFDPETGKEVKLAFPLPKRP